VKIDKQKYLTNKIMKRIVEMEEWRLRKSVFTAVPGIVVSVLLFVYSFYSLAYEATKRRIVISELSWEEIARVWASLEKGLFLVIVTTVIALILILVATDFLTVPSRYKELKDYKKKLS